MAETDLSGIIQSDYDRSACEIGIVHLGFGAFHRAHQAVYVDRYMELTGDLRWGIAAVNLRASESDAFADAQTARDGYLLKTTSPDGEVVYRLVRAHVAFADWAQDADAAESLLTRESVHAVSITVTESGYYLKQDGTLNTAHPAIEAELGGGAPTTVYAYLTRALSRRLESGARPLTIMCCDNIRGNGKMLARNLLAYLSAAGRDAVADYVRAQVTFPCSMVDRITPRTSDALLAEVAEAFPGERLAPVHGESFIQWVLEQKFAGPMPDLAQSGVQVVRDVDPFEEAKIRILNGGHTGLCYLGVLAGFNTFDEAIADPALRAHFDGWEQQNVLPGLRIALPFDKADYLAEIAARFGNAAIADSLERICMDGWSKMQIFIRPTLSDCLDQGISPDFGYAVIASWYQYARLIHTGRINARYHEPFWDLLTPLLAKGQETAFARNAQLWADLPDTHEDFVPKLLSAIQEMDRKWPA